MKELIKTSNLYSNSIYRARKREWETEKESERQRNRKSQTTDGSCSFGVVGGLPSCRVRQLKSEKMKKKTNKQTKQNRDEAHKERNPTSA